MAGLAARGAAMVRQMRRIGPWRAIIGLVGLAASYGGIGLSLSGGSWNWYHPFGFLLGWFLPFTTWLFFSYKHAGSGVLSDQGRSAAAIHLSLVTLILFVLWGSDLLPLARPQSAEDFRHLLYPLTGLIFATMILASPPFPAADDSGEGEAASLREPA